MNRIASMVALISIVAALLPATALGQEQSNSGTTGKLQQQKPAKPATSAKHRAKVKGDIRHCLEFTENVQVIKCAEKRR